MQCITANILQTKVDAQWCDKLETELSWHRLRYSMSSYNELFCPKFPVLTYPARIWCLRRGWPRLSFAEIFSIRRVLGLSFVVSVILRLAVLDRQTHEWHDYGICSTSMASCDKILLLVYCCERVSRKLGLCFLDAENRMLRNSYTWVVLYVELLRCWLYIWWTDCCGWY